MFLAQVQQVKALVPQRRLRVLMRRTDGPGWLYLVRHIGWLAVTGGIVWQAIGTAWLVPAMSLHGIGIVHLFSAQHEFAHRTAFRTRMLNDVFGNLFGFIILLPHVYFRWEHTDHHTYTQVADRDPQLIPQPKSLWQYFWYLSTIPYWLGFLKPFVRHVIGNVSPKERRFIPATETWKVVWEARAMLATYAGLLALSLWLRTEALWFYWLGPRLLAEPFMRFIRMTEHVGRPVNEPDLLQNSRTCIVWAPLRWLAWNMPFHAEHHLSPGVPFHALPALHRDLRGVPRPITGGYHGAHREILGRILHADAVTVSPS
jgi:fatty acid desaturase